MSTLYSSGDISRETGKPLPTVRHHARRLGLGSRLGGVLAFSATERRLLVSAIVEAKRGNPRPAEAGRRGGLAKARRWREKQATE